MIKESLNKSLNQGIELKDQKKLLVDYHDYLPMYDIYSESIILIKNTKLFERMKTNHYRFIDKRLFLWLNNKYNKLKEKKNKNTDEKRTLLKLKNGIKFLKNYNLDNLYNNSIETMYIYSPEIGLNITICKKKSFIPYFNHLKPYYSKDELINLGLNMNAISKINKETLINDDKHYEICKLISNNDITKELILSHTEYIKKSKSKYLIMYYSLYGSYFMNKFLRNYFTIKNDKLITNSKFMTTSNIILNFTNKLINTINNAPAFDNDYILYRFVTDDSYLKNLKVGNIFVETGFMSTTRDPFYSNNNENEFGFILLKIRIPKNIKGIGLNIELYSHFNSEEEVILAPFSKFKLISKNDNFNYYHIDKKFENKIKKKYEFEYIGKLDIQNTLSDKNVIKTDKIKVDFLNIKIKGDSIIEKINYFVNNYTNSINEFYSNIDNNQYQFNIHWFDSTGPYKKFYYLKTKLGFSIILYDLSGKVLLIIEIGEIISVNYYLKFIDNSNTVISNKEIINFIAKISYAFNIFNTIIHTDYTSFNKFSNNYDNNLINSSLDCFNYSLDFYNYFKNNVKRFDNFNSVYAKFNYFDLDILKKKTLNDIYSDDQINEIKIFLESDLKNIKSLADYLIYIIENKFYLYKRVIRDFRKVYTFNNNPFLHKYYYLEVGSYLYNNKLIKYLPLTITDKSKEIENKLIDIDEYKNIYRKGYRN